MVKRTTWDNDSRENDPLAFAHAFYSRTFGDFDTSSGRMNGTAANGCGREEHPESTCSLCHGFGVVGAVSTEGANAEQRAEIGEAWGVIDRLRGTATTSLAAD